MASAEVPDFLTVEEAGRVLRIGRTAAYQQARRWLDTRTDGLPVLRVGGSCTALPVRGAVQHPREVHSSAARAPPAPEGRGGGALRGPGHPPVDEAGRPPQPLGASAGRPAVRRLSEPTQPDHRPRADTSSPAIHH